MGKDTKEETEAPMEQELQKEATPKEIEAFMEQELQKLEKKYNGKFRVANEFGIVTRCPRIVNEVYYTIGCYAKYDSKTVFIVGESGTGKELVAKALHRSSERRQGNRFLAVNCGAIPRDLFETIMFGHEKGTFTGAAYAHDGLFIKANEGTLFLDEAGKLDKLHQSKFLRILEDKLVYRIGSDTGKPVDVRVIFATSSDLKQRVEREEFDNGLYHRIKAHEIALPPLRERAEDIPLLAEYFLKQFQIENRHIEDKKYEFASDALSFLESYSWPGNVRELKNTIEAAAILSNADVLAVETLEKVLKYSKNGSKKL